MPIESEAQHRPDLQALLWEYAQQELGRKFVGLNMLAPLADVAYKEAGYYKVPTDEFLRVPDTTVGRQQGYNRVDFGMVHEDFSMQEHGLEHLVKDQDMNRYAEIGLDAEAASTRVLMVMWLLSGEKRVLDVVQDTSIFAEQTVDTAWSSTSTSDPLADINGYKESMENATGMTPNALAVSSQVFRYLQQNDAIQSFLEATQPSFGDASVTQEMMRQYFDVDYFGVSKARYVSSPEGEAESMTAMLSDEYAFLARVSENPEDFNEPCALKTFTWTGDAPENPVVEDYRDEHGRGTVYRVRNQLQTTDIMSSLGYLIDTEQTA